MAASIKPFKIVLLGANGTGKTALIQHLVHGNHMLGCKYYPATIEDIYRAEIDISKNISYRLCLFDTSGKVLASDEQIDHYIWIADGVILLYNITVKTSFDSILALRKKISRDKDLPLMVLGTHSDCEEQRCVDKLTTMHWAEMQQVRAYEVTLTNRDTLKEPFITLVSQIAAGKNLPTQKK